MAWHRSTLLLSRKSKVKPQKLNPGEIDRADRDPSPTLFQREESSKGLHLDNLRTNEAAPLTPVSHPTVTGGTPVANSAPQVWKAPG